MIREIPLLTNKIIIFNFIHYCFGNLLSCRVYIYKVPILQDIMTV